MKYLVLIVLFLLMYCSFKDPKYQARYHKPHSYKVLDTIPVKDGLLIRHKCTLKECGRIDSFLLRERYSK